MNLKKLKDKFSIDEKANNELEITILSPYLSQEFLKQLIEVFSPSKLFVVTDKSGELEASKIKDKSEHNIKIHLAECDGIVHAKLFLFTWEKSNQHILLWGSCNATVQAFNKNAEVYSWCPIFDDELITYFEKLRALDKNRRIAPLEVTLNNIRLYLPEFEYSEQAHGFDMWLEEGRLFFPEALTLPDSFKIQLKKDVRIKEIAEKHKFNFKGDKTLTYPFIEKVTLPWIKHYSIQTIYGYWIPKEVTIWYERNKYILENKIGNYVKKMEEKESEIINESFKDIQNFSCDLLPKKGSLKEYFEDKALTKNGRELDEEYFRQELKEQLEEHIRKCKKLQKEPLKTQQLPSIRSYKKQWDDFAWSFIESIKESKGRGLSKIIKEKLTRKSSQQKELVSSCFIEWGETPETILNNLRECYHLVKQGIGEGLTQELEDLSKSGKPKKK